MATKSYIHALVPSKSWTGITCIIILAIMHPRPSHEQVAQPILLAPFQLNSSVHCIHHVDFFAGFDCMSSKKSSRILKDTIGLLDFNVQTNICFWFVYHWPGRQRRSITNYSLHIGTKDFTLPKTRNIGIIAHIDAGKQVIQTRHETEKTHKSIAGKTTTTERMLYYAGVTKRIGGKEGGWWWWWILLYLIYPIPYDN